MVKSLKTPLEGLAILALSFSTLVSVKPTSLSAAEEEWKEIKTFSGSSDKTTEPFEVSSNRWRINWEADAGEMGIFGFFVYPEGETVSYVESVSHDGGGSDTTYIYEGSGSYYLKVLAANLSSWAISVEEGPMKEEAEEKAKDSEKKDSGCFIATAAYGTSLAPEIGVLREFRDEVLLENVVGTRFVETYYEVSPPIADFILEHPLLRATVRGLGVRPLVSALEATRMGGIW